MSRWIIVQHADATRGSAPPDGEAKFFYGHRFAGENKRNYYTMVSIEKLSVHLRVCLEKHISKESIYEFSRVSCD